MINSEKQRELEAAHREAQRHLADLPRLACGHLALPLRNGQCVGCQQQKDALIAAPATGPGQQVLS